MQTLIGLSNLPEHTTKIVVTHETGLLEALTHHSYMQNGKHPRTDEELYFYNFHKQEWVFMANLGDIDECDDVYRIFSSDPAYTPLRKGDA